MNTSGTSTDVFAVLAVAQANWPHDPVAGSEAVWTKWSEALRRYSVEEITVALDELARTRSRVPSLAELLGELGARRSAASTRKGGTAAAHQSHHTRWPPVPLAADYVIGAYSLAFAEMNSQGWTVERLVECVRAATRSTSDPTKRAPRPSQLARSHPTPQSIPRSVYTKSDPSSCPRIGA